MKMHSPKMSSVQAERSAPRYPYPSAIPSPPLQHTQRLASSTSPTPVTRAVPLTGCVSQDAVCHGPPAVVMTPSSILTESRVGIGPLQSLKAEVEKGGSGGAAYNGMSHPAVDVRDVMLAERAVDSRSSSKWDGCTENTAAASGHGRLPHLARRRASSGAVTMLKKGPVITTSPSSPTITLARHSSRRTSSPSTSPHLPSPQLVGTSPRNGAVEQPSGAASSTTMQKNGEGPFIITLLPPTPLMQRRRLTEGAVGASHEGADSQEGPATPRINWLSEKEVDVATSSLSTPGASTSSGEAAMVAARSGKVASHDSTAMVTLVDVDSGEVGGSSSPRSRLDEAGLTSSLGGGGRGTDSCPVRSHTSGAASSVAPSTSNIASSSSSAVTLQTPLSTSAEQCTAAAAAACRKGHLLSLSQQPILPPLPTVAASVARSCSSAHARQGVAHGHGASTSPHHAASSSTSPLRAAWLSELEKGREEGGDLLATTTAPATAALDGHDREVREGSHRNEDTAIAPIRAATGEQVPDNGPLTSQRLCQQRPSPPLLHVTRPPANPAAVGTTSAREKTLTSTKTHAPVPLSLLTSCDTKQREKNSSTANCLPGHPLLQRRAPIAVASSLATSGSKTKAQPAGGAGNRSDTGGDAATDHETAAVGLDRETERTDDGGALAGGGGEGEAVSEPEVTGQPELGVTLPSPPSHTDGIPAASPRRHPLYHPESSVAAPPTASVVSAGPGAACPRCPVATAVQSLSKAQAPPAQASSSTLRLRLMTPEDAFARKDKRVALEGAAAASTALGRSTGKIIHEEEKEKARRTAPCTPPAPSSRAVHMAMRRMSSIHAASPAVEPRVGTVRAFPYQQHRRQSLCNKDGNGRATMPSSHMVVAPTALATSCLTKVSLLTLKKRKSSGSGAAAAAASPHLPILANVPGSPLVATGGPVVRSEQLRAPPATSYCTTPKKTETADSVESPSKDTSVTARPNAPPQIDKEHHPTVAFTEVVGEQCRRTSDTPSSSGGKEENASLPGAAGRATDVGAAAPPSLPPQQPLQQDASQQRYKDTLQQRATPTGSLSTSLQDITIHSCSDIAVACKGEKSQQESCRVPQRDVWSTELLDKAGVTTSTAARAEDSAGSTLLSNEDGQQQKQQAETFLPATDTAPVASGDAVDVAEPETDLSCSQYFAPPSARTPTPVTMNPAICRSNESCIVAMIEGTEGVSCSSAPLPTAVDTSDATVPHASPPQKAVRSSAVTTDNDKTITTTTKAVPRHSSDAGNSSFLVRSVRSAMQRACRVLQKRSRSSIAVDQLDGCSSTSSRRRRVRRKDGKSEASTTVPSETRESAEEQLGDDVVAGSAATNGITEKNLSTSALSHADDLSASPGTASTPLSEPTVRPAATEHYWGSALYAFLTGDASLQRLSSSVLPEDSESSMAYGPVGTAEAAVIFSKAYSGLRLSSISDAPACVRPRDGAMEKAGGGDGYTGVDDVTRKPNCSGILFTTSPSPSEGGTLPSKRSLTLQSPMRSALTTRRCVSWLPSKEAPLSPPPPPPPSTAPMRRRWSSTIDPLRCTTPLSSSSSTVGSPQSRRPFFSSMSVASLQLPTPFPAVQMPSMGTSSLVAMPTQLQPPHSSCSGLSSPSRSQPTRRFSSVVMQREDKKCKEEMRKDGSGEEECQALGRRPTSLPPFARPHEVEQRCGEGRQLHTPSEHPRWSSAKSDDHSGSRVMHDWLHPGRKTRVSHMTSPSSFITYGSLPSTLASPHDSNAHLGDSRGQHVTPWSSFSILGFLDPRDVDAAKECASFHTSRGGARTRSTGSNSSGKGTVDGAPKRSFTSSLLGPIMESTRLSSPSLYSHGSAMGSPRARRQRPQAVTTLSEVDQQLSQRRPSDGGKRDTGQEKEEAEGSQHGACPPRPSKGDGAGSSLASSKKVSSGNTNVSEVEGADASTAVKSGAFDAVPSPPPHGAGCVEGRRSGYLRRHPTSSSLVSFTSLPQGGRAGQRHLFDADRGQRVRFKEVGDGDANALTTSSRVENRCESAAGTPARSCSGPGPRRRGGDTPLPRPHDGGVSPILRSGGSFRSKPALLRVDQAPSALLPPTTTKSTTAVTHTTTPSPQGSRSALRPLEAVPEDCERSDGDSCRLCDGGSCGSQFHPLALQELEGGKWRRCGEDGGDENFFYPANVSSVDTGEATTSFGRSCVTLHSLHSFSSRASSSSNSNASSSAASVTRKTGHHDSGQRKSKDPSGGQPDTAAVEGTRASGSTSPVLPVHRSLRGARQSWRLGRTSAEESCRLSSHSMQQELQCRLPPHVKTTLLPRMAHAAPDKQLPSSVWSFGTWSAEFSIGRPPADHTPRGLRGDSEELAKVSSPDRSTTATAVEVSVSPARPLNATTLSLRLENEGGSSVPDEHAAQDAQPQDHDERVSKERHWCSEDARACRPDGQLRLRCSEEAVMDEKPPCRCDSPCMPPGRISLSAGSSSSRVLRASLDDCLSPSLPGWQYHSTNSSKDDKDKGGGGSRSGCSVRNEAATLRTPLSSTADAQRGASMRHGTRNITLTTAPASSIADPAQGGVHTRGCGRGGSEEETRTSSTGRRTTAQVTRSARSPHTDVHDACDAGGDAKARTQVNGQQRSWKWLKSQPLPHKQMSRLSGSPRRRLAPINDDEWQRSISTSYAWAGTVLTSLVLGNSSSRSLVSSIVRGDENGTGE